MLNILSYSSKIFLNILRNIYKVLEIKDLSLYMCSVSILMNNNLYDISTFINYVR